MLVCYTQALRLIYVAKATVCTYLAAFIAILLYIAVPPPEITIPPENITTTTYTSITFSCSGRGYGEVTVIWTKPPSKVSTTATYTFNRYDDHVISTLTLNYVVGIYSGSYCCAIVNHVGSSPVECAHLKVTSKFLYIFT